MGRDLGRFVQQCRHRLGLSRRELADRSGVSYPYVSQIETGEREPSLRTMHALALVLDVPVEHLAGLTSPAEWLTKPAAAPASAPAAMNFAPEKAVDPLMKRTAKIESANRHDPIQHDPVEMWRDKVMPAVERKLNSVPPVERVALLNELLAQAVEDLVLEQSDRTRPRPRE